MTDNDVIKALECISGKEVFCHDCKYSAHSFYPKCKQEAGKDALDLINRQQAEIERLQEKQDLFADIGKMYSEIKADAVKEFADMVKENASKNDFICMDAVIATEYIISKHKLDDLLKEVGDKK